MPSRAQQAQIGGSDQWGNITAGCELVRRVDGATVHALTTQLLTKADGTKFGKTESGTVWLDPTMTSPYAFYQFWFNTDDRDVVAFLKIFSARSTDEIAELADQVSREPASRGAQRALAEELTALVHGERAVEQAVAAAQALFGRGSIHDLDETTLASALQEAGVTLVGSVDGETVVDLLAASGLVASKSAARRAIDEGGAYLNNERISDPDAVPREQDWLHGRFLLLRKGKRSIAGIAR